ncbi:MAG: TonB-dependent receptor [Anditalea sp.]
MQEINFMEARLIGGISLDHSPSQYEAEFINVDRNENGLYTSFHPMDSLLSHYQVNLMNTAAFVQFEISPLERLKLILAARYDHFLYDYDIHQVIISVGVAFNFTKNIDH